MSGTYIAWNGEPYPWPPPDGWYKGSDGRWWAPGSGPEPDSGIHSNEDAKDAAYDCDLQDGGGNAQLAKAETEPATVQSDQQTVIAKPSTRPLPGHTETPLNDPADPQDPLRSVANDDGDGPFKSPLLLAGAAVLILLGVGVGFLAVRNNDSATTNPDFPTTTAAFGETTLPPATSQPTTLSQSEPTPVTAPPTTTTQNDPDTTVAEPGRTTTTEATDEQKAAAFRADLDGRGISSAELSDADIIDFGKSFCVFAVVSVDTADFDTYRSRAQTGVSGKLNEAQLDAAINAAVVSYCPDEAERLGIEP